MSASSSSDNQASPPAQDTKALPFEVSSRAMLAVAVPMTLSYMTTPLIGMVDTGVVGRLGDAAALAGLAGGAVIFDFLFGTLNFLRSGTTGLVAQAFGRGDRTEKQAVFWRAGLMAVGLGFLLLLLSPLLISAGVAIIGGEPGIAEAMRTYLGIRMISVPFALVNYVVLGFLIGRAQARLALALQVFINLTNMALSIWFGLGLGYGVAGVAAGSVISEMLAAIIGSALILRGFDSTLRPGWTRITDRSAIRRLVAINGDILVRSLVLMGAFTLFTRQGAQLGAPTMAANAILMHIFLLAGFSLDGFAAAAEQFAGRAVGADSRPAFDRSVQLATRWGFALAAVFAVLALVFGTYLIALLTTLPEVTVIAGTYLPWAAATALTGVLAFEMDGVYIGATWTGTMRNMMLLSFVIYAPAVFALTAAFGNAGLWAALNLFLLARGISLLLRIPAMRATTFSPG